MIHVDFRKERALQVLGALGRGEAIAPVKERWTVDDALLVAGALLFSATDALRDLAVKEGERLPLEHVEARLQHLKDEALIAIGWYSEAARLVRDGRFDESFEKEVEAILARAGNGESRLVGLKGFKVRPQ